MRDDHTRGGPNRGQTLRLRSGQVAAARLVLVLAMTAAPLTAQNNGLPTQQQGAVLVEVIAIRGAECELLKPWQAASLRMQTRDQIARFDDSTQAAIHADVDARAKAMTCDDAVLVQWITAAAPNMEREYLPEMLTAYKAVATMSPRPAPFDSVTGRSEYTDVVARIDTKLAAMVAAGVRLPSGMTLDALNTRQAGFATQIGAAIAGTDTVGRFTADQARQIVIDAVRIVELWLHED